MSVTIWIPNADYILEPNAIITIADELDRLERPIAAALAQTLRDLPTRHELSPEGAAELVRALNHLRNLSALPSNDSNTFGAARLREALIARFETHRYLLDAQDARPPIATSTMGPLYGEGDRLVDATGGEWFVRQVEAGPEPIRVIVDPWRPASQRF
jgi:hypothetical protein